MTTHLQLLPLLSLSHTFHQSPPGGNSIVHKNRKFTLRFILVGFALFLSSLSIEGYPQDLHLTCVGETNRSLLNQFISEKNSKTRESPSSRYYRFEGGRLQSTDKLSGINRERTFGDCLWTVEKISCSPKNDRDGCRFVNSSSVICENRLEISRTSGIVQELHHEHLKYAQIGETLRVDIFEGVCKPSKLLF